MISAEKITSMYLGQAKPTIGQILSFVIILGAAFSLFIFEPMMGFAMLVIAAASGIGLILASKKRILMIDIGKHRFVWITKKTTDLN